MTKPIVRKKGLSWTVRGPNGHYIEWASGNAAT